MFEYLRGTVIEKTPSTLILEVGGVGYFLEIPSSTFEVLGEPGKAARVLVHYHVREDTQKLFGAVMFINPDPTALALRIIADFDARREALGWQIPSAPTRLRLSTLQQERATPHKHHHHHQETEEHHHD